MTSNLWRLRSAAALSVIAFLAMLGTALAAGPVVVVPIAPLDGDTRLSATVSVKAGISAAYLSISASTFQRRDPVGNLVPAVIFAARDESGNSILRPIFALLPATTSTASSDVSGSIRGIRFYKHATNSGAHVGNLWKNEGTLSSSAGFASASPSGRQQVTLSPVTVDANTTDVACCHSNIGHCAADANVLAWDPSNPPLRALHDAVDSVNDVSRYAASSRPNENWNATNDCMDVVITAAANDPTIPLEVLAVTPLASSVGVSAATTVTAVIGGVNSFPSLSASTVELHDRSGSLVPATVLGGGESQMSGPAGVLIPVSIARGRRDADGDSQPIVTASAFDAVHRDDHGRREGPGGQRDGVGFPVDVHGRALAKACCT